MNLQDVSRLTETEARETIERILWPHGPVCPHCGVAEGHTKMEGKAHREGLYNCNACREQFTVTVGTLFERSHIPLRTWLMAFAILCSAKKGISALQLKRALGLGSYQTAWHMAMRIRHAMAQEPLAGLLKGTVEVDETYVGGKPRKPALKGKTGRGTKKTPVLALVERDGRARAKVIPNIGGGTLQMAVKQHVDRSARVMTDDLASYRGLKNSFAGGHYVVRHSKQEYARGDVNTNTVESYFSLLKRGVIGSFHHISKEHMNRYLNEFSWRWNHRNATDSDRTYAAIKLTAGCRLMYKTPRNGSN